MPTCDQHASKNFLNLALSRFSKSVFALGHRGWEMDCFCNVGKRKAEMKLRPLRVCGQLWSKLVCILTQALFKGSLEQLTQTFLASVSSYTK